MQQKEKMSKLEQSIKRKQIQAKDAQKNGMHTTFGNLMSEISELKRQLRQMHMGSM